MAFLVVPELVPVLELELVETVSPLFSVEVLVLVVPALVVLVLSSAAVPIKVPVLPQEVLVLPQEVPHRRVEPHSKALPLSRAPPPRAKTRRNKCSTSSHCPPSWLRQIGESLYATQSLLNIFS